MAKNIILKHGRVLKVPENTIVVKSDPTIPDKEYDDVRVVINTQVGPPADIPVLILLRAEDFEGDIHELAASLVKGMDQYPVSENVRAVSVISCGSPNYEGINWLVV